MRTITIEIGDGTSGSYTVREGDRFCPELCWDEMLGTIAELTHPKIGTARYRMWTEEEHAAHRARHEARMDEIRAGQQDPDFNEVAQ
jgi:hypothetical protein